jgi:hypothetical protein
MSLNDEELVGTEELLADGTDTIFTGATVVSTTTGTKVIVLSGVDLFREPEQLEEFDTVTLTGTSPDVDGDYTVDEVLSLVSFSVKEAIGSSTGGTCTAKYPSGARKVGFDPTGLTSITATNVQDAIEEVDAALSGGGLTEEQHKTLRHLIHFIDSGPAEGFDTGAYRETTGTVFPTAIIWYVDDTKAEKIVEKNITWSTPNPSEIEWIIYDTDGTTALARVTDEYTYMGIFEVSVNRTIEILV